MLILYADPHLGLNRTSNTTPASRIKLRESITTTVDDILDHKQNGDFAVCLGDLFDTYSNPENTIRLGESFIELTDLVLAGNHDVVADADEVGSLELLKRTRTDKIVYAPFNEPRAELHQFSGIYVVSVPHVTTQELFEESLARAEHLLTEMTLDTRRPRILCLHCNFDSPHELTETSLNLTPEMAERMLKSFNHVFLGQGTLNPVFRTMPQPPV